MTKMFKLVTFSLLILLLFFTAIVIVLGFYEQSEPEAISYPKGELSDSIFISQNMEYIPNNSFTLTHELTNIPYSFDTIDAKKAVVGNGSIYEIDPYYIYFSELQKNEDSMDMMAEHLSGVLKYGVSKSNVECEILIKENGYLNGCEVEYLFFRLHVSGEDAYVASYRLSISEKVDNTVNEDILVSCITRAHTTQDVTNIKSILDLVICTLQYSKNAAYRIEREQGKNG